MPQKAMSQRGSEAEVKSWGFPHVFTWTDGPLTITYPKDEKPEKVTYGVGDRVDVDAGRVHEVWIGDGGCTYVIGE
ncbi:cupin-type protein [Colletotrichum tofieldiae]|nr:cupin-type protein [Colletotrichum tofieldiae]GKT69647.1 cupin-type protein [Colletotrichum tofieldiae]GKT92533.1 cupin-type protein [Colletotrichum tofieldiae]